MRCLQFEASARIAHSASPRTVHIALVLSDQLYPLVVQCTIIDHPKKLEIVYSDTKGQNGRFVHCECENAARTHCKCCKGKCCIFTRAVSQSPMRPHVTLVENQLTINDCLNFSNAYSYSRIPAEIKKTGICC